MPKNKDGPLPPFRWGAALRNAFGKGTQAAALAGLSAAVTVPEPVTVATICGIQFTGAAIFGFAGEYMNHRLDEPSAVFDRPTVLLFDTAGMVLGFLLFAIPAMQLDHALRPGGVLPGYFGIGALYLCAFLVTILRGLLVNLGLVESGTRERI